MKPSLVNSLLTVLFGILLLTGCKPGDHPGVVAGENGPTPTRISYTDTPFPAPDSTGLPVSPTASSQSTPDPEAEQLTKLYQTSLKYIAQTDAETWKVAASLKYAPLGGYPSNMCGPLAISILKDAGIVSRNADLHDFWLLNPEDDAQLLLDTFPVDKFERLHTDMPINEIDYSQFPLKAGDLVYIYSGFQGDYSHVLAVTRVDADGRAFSVTNNYTEAGFVVLEYMLYDPTQPGTGIFYAWPDLANRALGLTGFGGLDIWRPVKLPYYADESP